MTNPNESPQARLDAMLEAVVDAHPPNDTATKRPEVWWLDIFEALALMLITQFDGACAQLSEAQAKVREVETKQIPNLRGRLDASERENAGKWQGILELRAQLSELAAFNESAERECAAMRLRAIQAKAQLAERDAKIAELETHLVRVIGDHNAPRDCYSTGPMTGDPILDLVICPSCSAMEFLAREEQRKKETK